MRTLKCTEVKISYAMVPQCSSIFMARDDPDSDDTGRVWGHHDEG
jgi:hypothetical protein